MKPTKDNPLSASMASYSKGGVDIVDPRENIKRYVYSNVYEVGARAKPYEKIAVAKNGPYVVECIAAEGVMSTWRFSTTRSSGAIDVPCLPGRRSPSGFYRSTCRAACRWAS